MIPLESFLKTLIPMKYVLGTNQIYNDGSNPKKAFNHLGLFVLDQTHLVVPDNKNYIACCKNAC